MEGTKKFPCRIDEHKPVRKIGNVKALIGNEEFIADRIARITAHKQRIETRIK